MKKIFTFSLIIGLILMTFSPFTVNAQDVLQDEEGNRATSGVYSEWSSTPYNMNNYNCYGYAIGTFQNINPGYYSGYSWDYNNFSTFKNAVMYDLIALGYSNVHFVNVNYYLQPGERMIAFVAGDWQPIRSAKSEESFSSGVKQGEGHNFHFYVKYSNGGSWFHKFGKLSAIMRLKSNYIPTSSMTITDEYYASQYSYASAHFKYVGQSYGYVAFQPTIPINKIEAEIMQYNDSVN